MVPMIINVNVTEGANKAKIKFVGINNYAGELVKEFDITSAQIKAENITLGDTTYASGWLSNHLLQSQFLAEKLH